MEAVDLSHAHILLVRLSKSLSGLASLMKWLVSLKIVVILSPECRDIRA